MRAITGAAIAGGAALVGAGAYVAHRLATRHDPPKEGPTPGTPTYPWAGGNVVDLKVNYAEFVPAVLADLRAANDVINIVEYNWEPTGPSIEIAEILKQKARDGVEVNVLTDKRGSFGIDANASRADAEAYFDDLRSAGVNVLVHDPGGNLNPFGLYLDHRKMFDIDHRVSYTGGLGLAGSENGKYADWHDLMLRIEGPASAQAGAEFITHWARQGGVVSTRQHEAFAHAADAALTDATASARMLPNTPGVGLDATEDIIGMLDGPDRRVWAMTPYIGDEQVQQAMVRAARAGKDVRVLVPSPESGSNGPQLKISRAFYRELIDAGVRVYEYPTMMHAKAWLGDDRLTVGSTNLSDGALDEYLELSAAVKDDPKTIAKAEAMLEADFARSRELTLDEFGLGDRIVEKLRDVTHLEF
jgi:cardiolipin synthase